MSNNGKTGRSRIYYLDFARAAAIISISSNHAVNRAFAVQHEQAAETAVLPLYLNMIKAGVAIFSRIGVPLFLMITGALMLSRKYETREDVRRFYRFNWLGLFITAEIWFFIMFWAKTLMGGLAVLKTASLPVLIGRCILNQLFLNQQTMASMWYMQMLLPMYMLLPVFAVFLQKGFDRWVVPIAAILVYTHFLVPAVNAFLMLTGRDYVLSTELGGTGAVYYLMVYVLFGYWLHRYRNELRKKLSLSAGIVLWIAVFIPVCAYQLYAFGQEPDYVLNYNSPGVLLCGAVTFLLMILAADRLKVLRGPAVYLSGISFGIYFVHILIMQALYAYTRGMTAAWNPLFTMLYYEVVSVGGSILFIALTSRIPFCKKYMFMIKN
ncbi:MAG: acyltransferase [Sarcina sp.]|nr:acyltransferase [Sarcina sp.]